MSVVSFTEKQLNSLKIGELVCWEDSSDAYMMFLKKEQQTIDGFKTDVWIFLVDERMKFVCWADPITKRIRVADYRYMSKE